MNSIYYRKIPSHNVNVAKPVKHKCSGKVDKNQSTSIATYFSIGKMSVSVRSEKALFHKDLPYLDNQDLAVGNNLKVLSRIPCARTRMRHVMVFSQTKKERRDRSTYILFSGNPSFVFSLSHEKPLQCFTEGVSYFVSLCSFLERTTRVDFCVVAICSECTCACFLCFFTTWNKACHSRSVTGFLTVLAISNCF